MARRGPDAPAVGSGGQRFLRCFRAGGGPDRQGALLTARRPPHAQYQEHPGCDKRRWPQTSPGVPETEVAWLHGWFPLDLEPLGDMSPHPVPGLACEVSSLLSPFPQGDKGGLSLPAMTRPLGSGVRIRTPVGLGCCPYSQTVPWMAWEPRAHRRGLHGPLS